jgi:hypothetical protein
MTTKQQEFNAAEYIAKLITKAWADRTKGKTK